MFRALMGGGRDDASSRSSSRRKTSTGADDSRTSSRRQSKRSSASSVSSSRRSTRGDDRDGDRGLEDVGASRSVTGDSTTSYVTAEPQSYVDEPVIIERTPKYMDRDDDRSKTSRDTDRDSKKERRDTGERSKRDDRDRDRERERTRTRTRSGDDVNSPTTPSSSRYAPVSPGDNAAHFAAEIANPGFNQFPMQYDSANIPGNIPGASSPYHPPLDSHISQQFPGQLPETTAQPYLPQNPAGHAADYYNDQGQSVADQPGVRPNPPDVIVGAQPHLQSASPMPNPPPEPSSLGQVGAAADYYAGGDSTYTSSTTTTTAATTNTARPPKPAKQSKPSSRPSKPASGASIAGESATYGIGSDLLNQASSNYPPTPGSQSRPPTHGTPSQNGVGLALGGAAAGAAAAYMLNHHEHQSNSNTHTTQLGHHDDSYGIGIPPQTGNMNSSSAGNAIPYPAPDYNNRPVLRPPSYSSGGMQPGTLAYHQRHHGPFSAFVDFWRDPEGVGKFEDYTQAIGVCKYCFEPGTTSRDAPRKHHYHQRKRSPVVERYGSSSRVDKLTRYNSSEDDSRRKKSKGGSWLGAGLTGGLAGYVAKSLFSSKDFEDTYSIRSGERVDDSRRTTYEEGSVVSSGKASSTSRGVISRRSRSDDKLVVTKEPKSYRYSRRSSRSRSRSRSRDRRSGSGLKEAAIGAAVGSALTAAAAHSYDRSRSRSRSATRIRRRTSDSSGSVYLERSGRRGRSSPKGFRSFFTAPSANRRKKGSRKERGFFSFGNSSSSSGDFDLAFGGSDLHSSTVSARSSRSSKTTKSTKKQNIDAEILGLGLAATQLARSSSRKEITPRDLVRPSRSRPTKVEDDEWEDADSSDSAVSQNMAYGDSAHFASQESVASGSSFWPWSSRKKEKAKRQSAPPPADLYNSYSAEYGSNDGSSGKGSLQQVFPVPTADPSAFDVARMSTTSSPYAQPPLVRPGPIPLQQPQPFTPVSQSVYYPTTTATAPIISDTSIRQVGPEEPSSRDIYRSRRSNSSPVLPLISLEDGTSPGILKRRSTGKDSATVSFDLTEEQVGRQEEVDRRNREREERRRDEFAVLREEADELERRRERREKRREERRRREEAEAEEAAREAQRERRRKELKDEERRKDVSDVSSQATDRRDQQSSSWVTPAVVATGAAAAVVTGALVEKEFEDKESASNQSRYEERREKRRSQRRSASETQPEATEVLERQVVDDEDEKEKRERRIAQIAAQRIVQDANKSPVYESYQDFFVPDEIRHREQPSPEISGQVSPASEPTSTPIAEPYIASDTEKPNPSWPPLVINIIQPTPPVSHDGSVRDVHSPAPPSEPSDKEAPEAEVESKPNRPTTGSRVSWGEHQTHEYEVETPLSDKEEEFSYQVPSVPESRSDERQKDLPTEPEPLPRQDDDSDHTAAHSMPGSFDADVEFAATLAAGAEIAGFDPTVVTEDETYYRKDRTSKADRPDAYRAPAVESVEDLGDIIPGAVSQTKSLLTEEDSHEPESFTREVEKKITDEKAPSRSDVATEAFEDNEPEEEFRDESRYTSSSLDRDDGKKSKSKRRSKTRDEIDIESEEFSRQSASSEYSNDRQGTTSNGDEVEFDTTLKKVQSAPVTDDLIEEGYKERRRRKSKRSSTDRSESLDDIRSVAASAPGADEMEEYRSHKSSSRSRSEEADFDDDTRSLPDAEDDGERRRRRRHKRRSGDFDDTASVASSPAKIDEVREKRRELESSVSKDQQKDQEKKAGGFLSNLFGSKSGSVQRSSSTSGKRETQSEVGVDDRTSERRRKKRSSGGRSSSGDGWEVSSEAARSTTDLSQLGKNYNGEDVDDDSQSSSRRRREQRRRDKYEEIVDSARDASEKERYTTAESADDNDDNDNKHSFLGMRPEVPPVSTSSRGLNSNNEGGASGLAIKEALLSSAVLGLEDQTQQVQQRLRSRSVSPSIAEKTFELAPKSQSRPSSPVPGGEQESKPRRLSVFRASDSPTAVPLHFRKPPTSPNSSKRVSMSSPSQQSSPSSPRPGHRRPNSIEFKNVREIRPLWLVERHSSGKFDAEPEGPLPSLPSSKDSSRAPSVENLREAYEENAVADFYTDHSGSTYSSRKPLDLRISTDQLPPEEGDYLNSQQATPTAETYKAQLSGPPPIKKEKPKYEFHSPSELLQDPSAYQDEHIPEPPESLERLPSVAGSDIGAKSLDEGSAGFATPPEEPTSASRDENQSQKKSSGISSFLAGAGFASIVDAAVSAKVDSHEKSVAADHDRELAVTDNHEPNLRMENTDDSIAKDVPEEFNQLQGRDPSTPQGKVAGNLGDVVNAAVAAAVSGHDQTMTEDKADVPKDTPHMPGGTFSGIVDAAVAAAVGDSALSNAQPDSAKDDIVLSKELSVEEQKVTAEEPTIEDASQSATLTKKQKKKEKKKRKKSKDLGAAADDDDDAEARAARAEPLEPTSEILAAEETIAPESATDTKEVVEIPVDEPVALDEKDDIESAIRESGDQVLPIVETAQTESVTASAENDTRRSPGAEQEIRDANNEAPHVAAEPEDESFSQATSSKSKKKKKNKKKSQSVSEPEPVVIETSSAASVEGVPGPSATTDETVSLVQEEKPLSYVTSTGMSSEQVEDIRNVPDTQDNGGLKKEDESEKPIDAIRDAELAGTRDIAVEPVVDETEKDMTSKQGSQDAPELAEAEKQRSLDDVALGVPGQDETTELSTEGVMETVTDENDYIIETSEAPQQIVEEPISEDQPSTDLPQSETSVAEETAESVINAALQPSEEKEEEQLASSQSGKKNKSKKKKKKGKSLSVDEGLGEAPLEIPEPIQPQSEYAEFSSAEPAIVQTDDAVIDENKAVANAEVAQSTDADTQSKEIDDAIISTDQDTPEATVIPKEEETVLESESLGNESTDATQAAQQHEPSLSAPKEIDQTSEPQISTVTDIPLDSVPSDKQPLEESQTAESTVQEEEVPAANEESTESTDFAPVKSKKKKGKKGKRVSWADPDLQAKEEAEADPGSGSLTPVESAAVEPPTITPVEETLSQSAESESQLPAEQELPLPVEQAQSTETSEEPAPSTSAETELPVAEEPELSTTFEATDPSAFADAAPSTATDNSPIVESQIVQEEIKDLAVPQFEQEPEPFQPITADKPADVETDDFEMADSKSKRKKDKKKDRKKKKAAEALPWDEESADKLVTEDATEPTEIARLEDPGQVEALPVPQPNLDEQTVDITEENADINSPKTPAEEAKSIDVVDDDTWAQETSKSKKKKDKKKKKAADAAAAALLLDEESTDKPANDDAPEFVEAPAFESLEQAEPTTTEEPKVDQPKMDDNTEKLAAESQDPEIFAESNAEEMKLDETAEDGTWAQETSKSKKKKDKRKKKAMGILALTDDSSEKPAIEDSTETAEAVAQESPDQADSLPTERSIPDEQQVAQENPAGSYNPDGSADIPTETSTDAFVNTPTDMLEEEEAKSADLVEDDSWMQETSKSKKKKDKKKKKAAEVFADDKQFEEPITEDTAKLVETPTPENLEQSTVDEQKADVVLESHIEQPQHPESPAVDVKAAEVTDDNEWTLEASSKSKKKKDKKKKKAAEVLPWDEEPSSDQPDNEDVKEATALTAEEATAIEEDASTENQPSEAATEDVKTDEVPEDDGWTQEPFSKSKKKKDKKKNRQSIQLEVAQEESTRDIVTDEIKDIPEDATAVEPSHAIEDITTAKVEEDDVIRAELQPESVPQDVSQPLQPESLEDENSKSKAGKSKKKKGKKTKSKDEPMPWDAEETVEPESQKEAVSKDVTDTPKDLETIEPIEKTIESAEPPASTEVEASESTNPQQEEPVQLQVTEPTDSAHEEDIQVPTETIRIAETAAYPEKGHTEPLSEPHIQNTEQESPILSDIAAETRSAEESAKTTEYTEVSQLTEPNLNPAEPTEYIRQEPAEEVEITEPEAAMGTVEETGPLEDGNELSRRKSGKKSKKKKNRDPLPWDEPSTVSSEQQDPFADPSLVKASDETGHEDSSRPEAISEIPSTEEARNLPDIEEAELRSGVPDPDADVETPSQDASVDEANKPLSAKEKRKEKKKKRRTLDLSTSEPYPAEAAETTNVLDNVEQGDKDEQAKDEVASDGFAVTGKKGKKNKRQSVNWEEDIVQAAIEDEPKENENAELDIIQAVEERPRTPPSNDNMEPSFELSEARSVLQETPVDVDGKETFQSSDEAHTGNKEKDFDWTDNMVSPQVHSQIEASPFPVPSPTFDIRENSLQPQPFVDDPQSGQPVFPDSVAQDLPPIVEKESEETVEQHVDTESLGREADDADRAATKSAKGMDKKKKKQKAISIEPDESLIAEQEASTKTSSVQADDKTEFQDLPGVSREVDAQPETLPTPEVTPALEQLPQPDMSVEEEFEDVSSSKKKGKKKKKADAWSFADISESAEQDNLADGDQGIANPPLGEFDKELSVDNDEKEIQERAMIVSETQKDVEKTLTLDEGSAAAQERSQNEGFLKEELKEEQNEEEVAAVYEAPSRNLSKKEKRKQKKEKKSAGFEDEEPTAVSTEKEYMGSTENDEVVESVKEDLDKAQAFGGDATVNDENMREEQTRETPLTNFEVEQVAEVEFAPTSLQEEEPFARKLSKKEKRKNKKRMIEEVPEDKSRDDLGFEGQSDDIVSTPKEQEYYNDAVPEVSTGLDEPETPHVSLDPFDMPDADGDIPADALKLADFLDQSREQQQDAETAMRARELEKEADLDVAASLFEDSPRPEAVLLRQSSKKQKGKKNKKDKRNSQLSQPADDDLKETVEISQSRDDVFSDQTNDDAAATSAILQPIKVHPHEEGYDTKRQFTESDDKDFQAWPSVEFGNDHEEKDDGDKWAVRHDESEPETRQIATQDPESVIDDFGAKEVQYEAPRPHPDPTAPEDRALSTKVTSSEAREVELDRSAADDAKSSSSQSEDVAMAVETAMAAAGFLPSSAAPKHRPEGDFSTKIQYTGKKSPSSVGVHESGISYNKKSLGTEETNMATTKGRTGTKKIANIFPGLERVTYRRPSEKSEKQIVDTTTVVERTPLPSKPQFRDKELNSTAEAVSAHITPEVESTSKDRSSSLLFDSSPSTRLEPTPDITRRESSQTVRLQHSSGSLHRTQSIHGHHGGSTHGWALEDEHTPTKRASNESPMPLHSEHTDLSPPRTPLDPIRENDGSHVASQSPRLVMGEGPYVLERPDSRGSARGTRSLRKPNRSISADLRAMASQDRHTNTNSADDDWFRAGADEAHEKGKVSKAGRQEAGWAAPSATDRSQPPDPQQTDYNVDDDDFDRQHLEHIPSSSTYDPITDKGKRPVRGMTNVYEGWGETPNSPRSPTRPPSVRRRQSMQHLQELESRLDQLISENRLLAAAKEEAEHKLSRAGVARRKSDQALNSSAADLRDKEAEIARLTSSLEWMQSEVQRLTHENESINATHAELTAAHAREVDGLRTRQIELATGMESIVRDQIGAALAEKDVELRRLRDELAAARQTVQELQQQIVAATADDVLSIHDEDYFDNSCQRLCQHVQQWVLRFSKHSDLRRCRPLSEVRDTNVADRFENAILDGSDVDAILADRVRRRDVFVAVVMAMIWEYVFTRYLFGMDREQRQKLKALEKQLSDIGPRRAVAHWRALTLTLLAKRPSFAEQRVKDTEAVALEIMESLSQLLPPPQAAQSQLLESLRGVIRRAANLSIEMRTQRAEYVMLPPLQPEFDSQGDLARQVSFNASLMNERSGIYSSNEALEAQSTAVRLVLFPLVVKKGNDLGDGDEEIVVCPAQVLVAWPENERPRERDRMSTLGNRSVSSVVPSVDMTNVI